MVAHTIIPFVGGHLAKRFYEEPEPVKISGLMVLAVFANILIWLIPFTWLFYTISSLVPALAMVEDSNPPAYEALASNDDVEAAGAPADPNNKNLPGLPVAPGKPITSSIRATHRLLGNVGGWRGRFRGIVPAAVYVMVSGFIDGMFTSTGSPLMLHLGSLVASLALVQLGAGWVHIIMTPPSPLPFWRRLPPLRRTFEATCWPVFVNWAAVVLSATIPLGTAKLLGLTIWNPKNPSEIPQYDADDAWKTLIVWLVSLASTYVLVVPSQVALVRVQASLLSPEEPTIVPFDSTFKGRVGPAVVDGKGYLTLRDAFATISRADWFRFLKLYVKIFIISFATLFVIFFTMGIQAVLLGLAHGSKSSDPQ